MVNYDREKLTLQYQAGLALRKSIEEIVDARWKAGIRNICWLGIGGTWASALQAAVHMREKSALDVMTENAGEYLTTGNRRIEEGTLVILSSVTGTTKEMVAAVDRVHEAGAFVLGFIDTPDTPLAKSCDACITSPKNEQLKFFMAADRLLHLEGVFADYDECYAQLDAHLAQDLAQVEADADAFAADFVSRSKHNTLTYFVGAGALYGATYSYAMCYWEEMHWMRTKSIHGAEFFHGMLEIVDADTPVVVLQGEDSQRPLTERVIRFLEKVSSNYTVIDSKDYAMPGIDEKYRGSIAHLIVHAVTNRIDAHLEAESGHDMGLRRYYRKTDY
ncbi:MAG: SIS domain-containing protein [Lachnospiraceae bacterium]|nr:SIS domain-containing protein [Lachnospiraceae bacterium]